MCDGGDRQLNEESLTTGVGLHHRSGKVVVELLGRLNKCGVISPRFDVPISKIENWSNQILPSR
jgi:ribosomal protein S8